MIADPHEGPRTCSRCVHRYACPTPQACEQAEEERTRLAAWRDFRISAALIAVLAAVILILHYWSPKP